MNVISGFSSMIMEIFIKIAMRLPQNNFDSSEYASQFSHIMGYVNYFVPFYIFKPIFVGWIGVMFVAFEILYIMRWVISAIH